MANVKDLLVALDRQTVKDLEVVFVVEKDRRLYLSVSDFVRNHISTRTHVLFRPSQAGLSASRNLGIAKSSGAFISFFDDDEIPFDDWAEKILSTFSSPDIIGVTGLALPLWEDPRQQWLPDELSWLWGGSLWFEDSHDKVVEIRNVGAMNCCFRREAFEQAGFFLERLGQWGPQSKRRITEIPGDEVEFSLRVRKITGKRIVYNPLAKVYHKVPRSKITPSFIAKRSFLMGYSKHMLGSMYHGINNGKPTLDLELGLISRMLTKLLPQTLGQFGRSPGLAFRRICVTTFAIICAGLGYLVYYVVPFNPENAELEGGSQL